MSWAGWQLSSDGPRYAAPKTSCLWHTPYWQVYSLSLSPPRSNQAIHAEKQPNRSLHYIKRNYPRETFHAVLERFFHSFWTPPHLNLTQVDVLAGVLADTGRFSPEAREAILAATKEQEVKDMLTRSTQEAVDKGAFGAPWLWVTNDEGKEEPFFGSDRYVGSLACCAVPLIGFLGP